MSTTVRAIVDAGTCCYTANRETRDYFRGTSAHSTVMVDGKPQVEPAGPFAWREHCGARLNRWLSNDSLSYADAEHDAYRSLPNPVTHRRRVAFIDSRYWVIVDDLDGAHIHRVEVRFQFDRIPVRATDRSWVTASPDGREGLLVRAFGSASLQTEIRAGQREPLEGWVSPDYGCMEPAPALIYSAATYLPLRVLTLLWPAENVDKTPAVDVMYDVHRRPFGITLRDRGETVMFTDDEPVIHHLQS